MDPRFERRRRNVRETTVQRRLRTVLIVAVLVTVVGVGVWVLQSPLLAIRDIGVYGVVHSDVAEVLSNAGIREGDPIVRVSPGKVEAMLEKDPWVQSAKVTRTFPHTIEVDITERTVAAAVSTKRGWVLLSNDGIVLGPADTVEPGTARLYLGTVDAGTPGEKPRDLVVGGALEFVVSLDSPLRSELTLDEKDGELWADVGGLSVRLGAPLEMASKANVLEALLERGIPDGSTINLIAPSRPTIEGSS
jgi:cell division protein FtsQ